MAFDLAQYYEDNKSKYGDRPMVDAAKDVFDQNKLGEKFGYKDHYEWLNDPANAKNKQAVQSDLEAKQSDPGRAARIQQQVVAQDAFDKAPSRVVFSDAGAQAVRGAAGLAGSIMRVPGNAAQIFNDQVGRFSDNGKGPIDQDTIDKMNLPGNAVQHVFGEGMLPVSKEEMTQPGRQLQGKVVGGVANIAGMMATGMLPAIAGSVGDAYSQTRQEAIAAGKAVPDAVNAATTSGITSGITQALFLKLLGGGFVSPFVKASSEELSSGIGKLLNGGLAKNAADFGYAAAGGTGISLGEVFAQAENKRMHGISDESGWDAVKKEFGPTALTNLIVGAMAPVSHAMVRSDAAKTLADPNANQARRQNYANMIHDFLDKTGNHEAAGAWASATHDLLLEKKPIDIGFVFDDANGKLPETVGFDDLDNPNGPTPPVAGQVQEGAKEPVPGLDPQADVQASQAPTIDPAAPGEAVSAPSGDVLPEAKPDAQVAAPEADNAPSAAPQPADIFKKNEGGDSHGLQTETGRPGQTEAPVTSEASASDSGADAFPGPVDKNGVPYTLEEIQIKTDRIKSDIFNYEEEIRYISSDNSIDASASKGKIAYRNRKIKSLRKELDALSVDSKKDISESKPVDVSSESKPVDVSSESKPIDVSSESTPVVEDDKTPPVTPQKDGDLPAQKVGPDNKTEIYTSPDGSYEPVTPSREQNPNATFPTLEPKAETPLPDSKSNPDAPLYGVRGADDLGRRDFNKRSVLNAVIAKSSRDGSVNRIAPVFYRAIKKLFDHKGTTPDTRQYMDLKSRAAKATGSERIRLKMLVERAEKDQIATGFFFPNDTSSSFNKVDTPYAIKMGLAKGLPLWHVGENGKKYPTYPNPDYVIRIWPDKNNPSVFHEFVVDKSVSDEGLPKNLGEFRKWAEETLSKDPLEKDDPQQPIEDTVLSPDDVEGLSSRGSRQLSSDDVPSTGENGNGLSIVNTPPSGEISKSFDPNDTSRHSLVDEGPATMSEGEANDRGSVKFHEDAIDDFYKRLDEVKKNRDEATSAEDFDRYDREVQALEGELDRFVSGHENAAEAPRGRNNAREGDEINMAPRNFEVKEDNGVQGEDGPDASRGYDPIRDADPRAMSHDAVETLLRHYTNVGNSDIVPLDRKLTESLLNRYPDLYSKYGHLLGKIADTSFPSGSLKINYSVKTALRLAQRVVSELRNYFTGNVSMVKSFGDLTPQQVAGLRRSGIPLDKVKAFYDPSGKYVLIADRHASVGDVLASVLHEGGHNAEQALFGSAAAADKFFSDVAGVFRTKVSDFLSLHNMADTHDNRMKVAREIFSDMIGDVHENADGTYTNHAVATMMQRAVAFVRNGIRAFGMRFGISGLDLHFTEGDIRAMVSRTIAGSNTLNTGKGVGFRKTFIDTFHPILAMQQNGSVDDTSNAHTALGLMRSRIGSFINEHIKPSFYSMGKLAKQAGLSFDEFNQYVAAAHAIERNNDIVSRNPDPQLAFAARQQNALHQSVVSNIEKRIGADGVKKLRQAQGELRSMLGRTLDRAVQLGYYTKKEADQIRRYQNYVTMKGDISGRAPGKLNVDVSSGIIKAQDLTSTAKPGDVLNDTMQTIRSIVVDVEKNFALQYLHNFARMNGAIKDITITNADGHNCIGVRVNGVQKFLQIDNNEVFRSLKSLDSLSMPAFMSAFQKYNRIRVKLDLGLNPLFWIHNLVGRDTIFGLSNLATMDRVGALSGGSLALRVLKDLPSVVKGLADINFRGGSAKWDAIHKRYTEAGGKMGLAFFGNDTNINANLKRIMATEGTGARASVLKIGEAFNTWAEHINDITENAVRLATFKHATEAGMSDFQAAALAKEVSVNFDRHGNIGQAMNALYLYSNAYIQGMDQVAKMIQRNPAKFTALATGLASAGFTMAYAQRAIFGDDYDKIPEHLRSKNLVMMTGGDNATHFKIAMPGELLPFYNVGQYFADLAAGRPRSAATLSLMSNIIDSINPIGGFNLDSDRSVGQSAAQAMTPSALRPFLEAFVQQNERGQHMKWYGGSIRKGEEGKYFINCIAGGLGKLLTTGYTAVTGQAKDLNDVPVLNGLVGEAPWYMKDQPQAGRFKEALADSLSTYDQIESLPDGERKKFMESLSQNDKTLATAANQVRTQLRILGSRRKKAQGAGRVGDVSLFDNQMRIVRQNFLDLYKRMN